MTEGTPTTASDRCGSRDRYQLPRREHRRGDGRVRLRRDRRRDRRAPAEAAERREGPALRAGSGPAAEEAHGLRPAAVHRRLPAGGRLGRRALHLRRHPAAGGQRRRRPVPGELGRRHARTAADPAVPGRRPVHGSGRYVEARRAALPHRGPGRRGRSRSPGSRSSSARRTASTTRCTRTGWCSASSPRPPRPSCARFSRSRSPRVRRSSSATCRPRSWSRAARTPSWQRRSRSSTPSPRCADATGADVTQLADALGYDKRIGRGMLNAGPGYGGGCLPKDLRAFMARAGELGVEEVITLLREVDDINQHRRARIVDVTHELLGARMGRPERDRPRCGLQGRHGRRPRLARTRRGRPDPAARRDRHRLRPRSDGERPPRPPDPALRRRRRRGLRGRPRCPPPHRVARVPRTRPGRPPRAVETPVIVDARLSWTPPWRAAGWTYRAPGQALSSNQSVRQPQETVASRNHRAGQYDEPIRPAATRDAEADTGDADAVHVREAAEDRVHHHERQALAQHDDRLQPRLVLPLDRVHQQRQHVAGEGPDADPAEQAGGEGQRQRSSNDRPNRPTAATSRPSAANMPGRGKRPAQGCAARSPPHPGFGSRPADRRSPRPSHARPGQQREATARPAASADRPPPSS